VRILLITHGYAPQVNPRSFRWTALAEHWAATHSAEIDVVTLCNSENADFEKRNGVNVYRVGSKVDSRLRAQAPVRVIPGLRWLYRQTWRKIMWPDYACLWYFGAAKKARELCAKHEYDWMISVSHPFTGHMVGLSVKRKFPQLPWMVDIGDPFAFLDGQPPNNRWLYKKLNFAAEERTLKQASIISVTTPKTQELYERHFRQCSGKIVTIPPLFRPATYAQKNAVTNNVRKKIVYVGTLYSTIRSPQPLLEVFARLVKSQELELHFYGAMNDCVPLFESYQELIGKNLFVHGLVSSEHAQDAIASCDILVNIGNETTYQLPSKTVECLASGKPILNVVSSAMDSSADFFSGYPSLFTLTNAEAASTNSDARLIEFINKAQPVDPSWTKGRLAPFTLDSVSGSYWNLLL